MTSAHSVIARNKSDVGDFGHVVVGIGTVPVIAVSALTGMGLAVLEAAVVGCADRLTGSTNSDVAINARHAQALGAAKAALQSARANLRNDGPVELLASDLRGVLNAFGEISGRVDNERMLDVLFASFCIGK